MDRDDRDLLDPRKAIFDIPFPLTPNPEIAESRQRSVEWLNRFGLIDTDSARAWHRRADLETLAGFTYPRARGADFDLANNFANFFVLFDDQFDYGFGDKPREVYRVAQHYADLFDMWPAKPDPEAPPLWQALADIWRRWGEGMSEAFLRRSSYHWQQFMMVLASESLSRQVGVASREAYLATRDVSGFMYPILDFCERVGHYEVPAVIFHSPYLTVMRHIAVQVPSLANDVASAQKERDHDECTNLVLVTAREEDVSLDAALAKSIDYVNARVREYIDMRPHVLALTAEVCSTAQEVTAVENYLADLEAWMKGYCEWQMRTRRYVLGTDGGAVPESFSLIG